MDEVGTKDMPLARRTWAAYGKELIGRTTKDAPLASADRGAAAHRLPPGGLSDVFVSGVSEYAWSRGQRVCYRIPALIRTTYGSLLAFASERLVGSGGCGDESPSNIVMRRSDDWGTHWSNATRVLDAGEWNLERSAWVIEDSFDGAVHLFSNSAVNATVGCECAVEVTTSRDGGLTWTGPTPVPPSSGMYGSGLATGITHSSGRLIGCMRKICRNSCPQDCALWESNRQKVCGVCAGQHAERIPAQTAQTTRALSSRTTTARPGERRLS